jgi:transposase-like protein
MRRQYTREFKLELCRKAVTKEASITAICREHGLSVGTFSRWMEQHKVKGEDSFSGDPWREESLSAPGASEKQLRARIKQLEAALGQAHLEVEFMQEALGKLGGHPGNGSR